MAKISKLITYLNNFSEQINEEVYDREEQQDNQRDKSDAWEDSEKGTEYIYKTEALDELNNLIFEVVEKAEKIKNKEYY